MTQMIRALRALKIYTLLLLCAVQTACGAPALSDPQSVNDPYESTNRTALAVNLQVDRFVWKPVAQAYDFVTPATVRLLVRNELSFLATPADIVNALLQGEGTRALRGFGRFFVNGTLGGLGLLDPASEFGLTSLDEDFGQTLAVWGVPEGVYWMLPLLGPSNLRDTLAIAPGMMLDPVRALRPARDWPYSVSKFGASVIEFRAQNIDSIDAFMRNSPDLYVSLRSVYRQKRNAAILNDSSGANGLLDVDAGR